LPEEGTGSVGGALWRAALAGGAAALHQPVGAIAPGFRADLVVLDRDRLVQPEAEADDLLDCAVFGGAALPVRDVMVAGIWRVSAGRHASEEPARTAFLAALREIAE
jgi:formimidoylglutamate deiminase